MKDALGHGSDPRGGSSGPRVDNRKRPPLAGHDYHFMTNDQLRYIQSDAHQAAQNMRGFDAKAEGKYLDQVNNASTVLSYRDRGGKDLSEKNKLTSGNVSPKSAVSTMHSPHVVSGVHDSTYRGNGEDRRGWKLHLDKQTGATVWGKP